MEDVGQEGTQAPGTGERSHEGDQRNNHEEEDVYEGYTGDMNAYCKSLEKWLFKAYVQRSFISNAYFTALSMMGLPSAQQAYGSHPGQGFPGFPPGPPNYSTTNGNARGRSQGVAGNDQPGPGPQPENNLQGQPRQTPRTFAVYVRGLRTNRNTTIIDFNIAPVWKRLVAEFIDFIILLIVKLFITLIIIDNFELIDFDNINIEAIQEPGNLYDVMFTLTTELIFLELIHRTVVCFFEGYCLYKGGATPGKSFMGLRVLHCEVVYPIVSDNRDLYNNNAGMRIIVTPGSFLTFPRAFLRTAMKNFSLAFFFPLCFTLLHFEHNRALYDIVAKSIVVEIY